jgi:uncharacterized membrane protein YfcA
MRKTTGIAAALLGLSAAVIAVPAWAAATVPNGTVISTSTTVKTVSSAKCYHSHQVTVTPYHWSSKTGWTKYPAPKKTVTDSTTCH